MALKDFEVYRDALKKLWDDAKDAKLQSQLIQKLVHKIEVGPKVVKIHYHSGLQYFSQIFLDHGSNSLTNGARVAEVEEPLWAVKSILFEFELDEVAEPKALFSEDLQKLVKKHSSFSKAATAIGASEAFVRQNSKRNLRQRAGK